MFNRPNPLAHSASGGRVIPDDDHHFPSFPSESLLPKDDLGFFPKRRATQEQIKLVELQVELKDKSIAPTTPPLLSHPAKHF